MHFEKTHRLSTFPIKGIIFSKDRAMQLHGLLSSYGCRCRDADQIPVSVIYRASSPAYRQAYELLQKDFKGNLTIHWIEETDLKKKRFGERSGAKAAELVGAASLPPVPHG